MNEDLKRCSKCDIEKELTELSFRRDSQKYRNHCRECINLINKEYQIINKDKIKIKRKEYREERESKKIEEKI